MEDCIYFPKAARVIAKKRFFLEDSPRYYEIYLWDDKIALQKYLLEKNKQTTLGLTCNEPVQAHINKIGEIHFAEGEWDLNIVAHECEHATMNIMRLLNLDYRQVVNEERICYLNGRLVQSVYHWLDEMEG